MPASAPLLYSRGFLLSDKEEPLLDGLHHFTKKQVGATILYHDEVVPVDIHAYRDGWLAIVGTVLETTLHAGSYSGGVASRLGKAFRDGGLAALECELYDLGGRYAVVASNDQGTWAYKALRGSW